MWLTGKIKKRKEEEKHLEKALDYLNNAVNELQLIVAWNSINWVYNTHTRFPSFCPA